MRRESSAVVKDVAALWRVDPGWFCAVRVTMWVNAARMETTRVASCDCTLRNGWAAEVERQWGCAKITNQVHLNSVGCIISCCILKL